MSYAIVNDIGLDEKILTDFASWLKEMNVIGLGVGALVGANTMAIGTSITDAVIMPVVQAIVHRTMPAFKVKAILAPILTFIVTMAVVFLLMRVFKVSLARPVDWVRVVNSDEIAKALEQHKQ
jgi:large-conductance mechanosensitive channel